MADVIEAVENDLPIPKEKEEGRGKKEGKRLKAKIGKRQGEMQPGEPAKAEAVMASQTQSDPVQAGQAESNLPVQPAGLGD
jgi:hypothetical protein